MADSSEAVEAVGAQPLFALPPPNPDEHVNIRYGRVLEAAELAGMTAQRCYDMTRQLLQSGDYQRAGDGFADVSGFIRSIPFAKLGPSSDLLSDFEQLAHEHGASQRAIAEATDQDHRTVGRHLSPRSSGADAPLDLDEQPETPLFEGEPAEPDERSGANAPLEQESPPDEPEPVDDEAVPSGDKPALDSKDEWYTPRSLFDGLGLRFDLDVCAPIDQTYSSVPADRHFTIEDDGLSQPWEGLVWCNPPYSMAAGWARRMIAHGNGLLLTHIPMNAEWCVEVWEKCDGARFYQGMDFVRPDGSSQRPAWWLQLVAFGDEAVAALAQLQPFGESAHNKRRVASPMWERVAP